MTSRLAADLFDPACPSSTLPFRIGDRWTGMLLLCLEHGPRRFGELRVPLRTVTPKVLADTLRAMRRDGLVTRTRYDENPPRVEYALTSLGRSLLPLIAAARAWSREHLPELLAARAFHLPDPPRAAARLPEHGRPRWRAGPGAVRRYR
ncbi:helix-turn-helix domain-containing protein [Micromonospora sp. WMMD1102]|uniref:winged helix-turn-helix transcriptional regulator n=1 Tax=Micromonospora sp. WMMD1102 TaxID=3016105 RepID=UPI0024154E97|nr:helix-turn-helix domain-containing protein [Micromonospora sp. WMMD1102]MDG4787918.1 helix-turn-helix domain-containing protein [Micromonospora sp. WMMD1102]